MTHDARGGAIDPAALATHYRAFLRPDRILLTGHSHQAWPDVARVGQLLAFDDAAREVDDKWGRAFAAADAVREAVAARIGARPEEIALGPSTHELVARFLSALDLRARPHLVTTSGEFHSLFRQLSRLREAGLEVTFVDAAPVDSLAERLAAAIGPRTAALMASSVLFETSSIVPGLEVAVRAAHAQGAAVLIDAYHAFGVVPFRVGELGPDPVFVVAGGYKYAQWGEGNCFLRVPAGTALRPVYTGWFADFAGLAHRRDPARAVGYGPRPCDVFAGSTYDPTSHYRAREVVRFFEEAGLTLSRLRASSLAQTARILGHLEGMDVRTPRADAARGGFVAVRVEQADAVVEALRARGVFVDARGDLVRFGPAPYLADDEIDAAMRAFRELTR